MGEERWPLGSAALAIVTRGERVLRVRLQGVITAMAFEAVHLRLAGERAGRRELVLDHDALVVVTCRSAVEAALRGTPAGRGDVLHVVVPSTKLPWAEKFCRLMAEAGQPCAAGVIDRWPAEAS